MIYEHRAEPPLSRRQFARRIVRHVGAAALLVAGSIAAGTAGYHWLGEVAWIDAFLNACMLLGGMGPIGELRTSSGWLRAMRWPPGRTSGSIPNRARASRC